MAKAKAPGAAKAPETQIPEVIDTPSADEVIDAPAVDDVIDTPPIDDIDTEILEMLSAYAEAYPDAKGFYVSSDRQVFLEKNKAEAFAHQRSLQPGTEPEHYSIK